MAFDKAEYDKNYLKSNYDSIAFRIPKGRKADLKKAADLRGISVNRLIADAIEHYCGVDLSPKD